MHEVTSKTLQNALRIGKALTTCDLADIQKPVHSLKTEKYNKIN